MRGRGIRFRGNLAACAKARISPKYLAAAQSCDKSIEIGFGDQTNLIGNAVATIVVAKWEKGLASEALKAALDGGAAPVTRAAVQAGRD